MVLNTMCRHVTSLMVWIMGVLFLASVAPADDTSISVDADLLVVGGTESGCAAAVQAARMGVQRIVIVNDIDWLGGQFSAESLTAFDENRSQEETARRSVRREPSFPRSGIFKELMNDIESMNQKRTGHPRPGNNAVMTNARPKDAETAFRNLLAPYLASGQIRLYSNFIPTAVTVSPSEAGDAVTGVTFTSAKDPAKTLSVRAKITIDASDWGEIIKLSGAAYEFGPDLQEKYGEPRAPKSRDQYPLTDMNPITYCMVVLETDGEHVVPRPVNYDERRYFNTTHLTKEEFAALKWPHPPVPAFASVDTVYSSRRIVDHYNIEGVRGPDAILLCWFVQDYPLDVLPNHVIEKLEATEPGASKKNIVEMTREQRQIIFEDAKQHSLGMLHHLQTTVHDRMPDKTHSFRRFKLTDEFGTPDNMPPKPYIRESLRLKAMYMMRQQDTTPVGPTTETYGRVMYHDGVACWQFEYDFHMTGRTFLPGEEGGTAWSTYFKPGRTWGPPYAGLCLFPLRSLIPEKMNGLLGAQKNLGYSSIISAAIRLHDQCVAIGQSSGAAAAVQLLNDNVSVRDIPFQPDLLQQVREGLCTSTNGGIPLALWPFRDLVIDDPSYIAANLLAVSRMLPIEGDEVEFRPNDPATPEWIDDVISATKLVKNDVPESVSFASMTRGEFAIAWWNQVKDLPNRPFVRLSTDDADQDGIPDSNDALPLDPRNLSFPPKPLPPDQDGLVDELPPELAERAEEKRQFQFTGRGSIVPNGFESDFGERFLLDRGWGWDQDLTGQYRVRQRLPEPERDSFIFTRDRAIWELAVPEGRYYVTVCVGDASHPQPGQRVTVEGIPVIRDVNTPTGKFHENSVEVDVRDGRLTVLLGPQEPGMNTTLNWIRVVKLKVTP